MSRDARLTSPPGPRLPETLLRVRDLKIWFRQTRGLLRRRTVGRVRAVDGIGFHIDRGETLGLVGESGCGKSSCGRGILRLVPLASGEIVLDGKDVARLSGEPLRQTRRRMQMVFQDPYSSLNPRMRVGEIIAEPLRTFSMASGTKLRRVVGELMEECGLDPESAHRFPREFSGGERQRIGIARALALKPDLVVADEPVSALDISIRAQILGLLRTLQRRHQLSYLFISHDLATVRSVAQRVAVMYVGKLVEEAPAAALVEQPLHPYTRALISAVPVPDPLLERRRQRIVLQGEVPSSISPPPGCRFQPRCPVAETLCRVEAPPMREVAPGHRVACHLVESADPGAGRDAALISTTGTFLSVTMRGAQ